MSDINSGIWLIYDGECPICRMTATYLKIKEEFGATHLVNARTDADHPLMQLIKTENIDLDEGFALRIHGHFYAGEKALQKIYALADKTNWIGRAPIIFRSRIASKIFYPILRTARNLLLKLRGIQKINNLKNTADPVFKNIFSKSWNALPVVMRRHYANRPYSTEKVVVNGTMDVSLSTFAMALAPIMKLTGILVPYAGTNIPTQVTFKSQPHCNKFIFNREFNFQEQGTYRFRSIMCPVGKNELIEVMRNGIGWHCRYLWEDEKVKLLHKGYAFKLFGTFIPLPVTWLVGKGYAEEWAIDNETFAMKMEIKHPLWGVIFGYTGTFKITSDVENLR